jgi:hypothetical protein
MHEKSLEIIYICENEKTMLYIYICEEKFSKETQ